MERARWMVFTGKLVKKKEMFFKILIEILIEIDEKLLLKLIVELVKYLEYSV